MTSSTFIEIRRIVIERNLNNGFKQSDITPHLSNGFLKSTCSTFTWKHAINGGNVKTLYFTRLENGKYVINSEFI